MLRRLRFFKSLLIVALLSACEAGQLPGRLSLLRADGQPLEILTVLPDAMPNEPLHFDLGQGRKTPYKLEARLSLSMPDFGVKSVNLPGSIQSFRLYVLSSNASPANPIAGGGPFVLNATFPNFYPQTRGIVFDNVPGPSGPLYYLAASAYTGTNGLGTNITGNGPRGGHVLVTDGSPEDAFVSTGGGNNDDGSVQILSPAHVVNPGHTATLLIFMTLD